ncbi:hypothetical protein BD410DRAFT_699373, partial [Rickenella mellea]
TDRISKMGVPLLYQVIPIMDKLTELLDATAANQNLHPVVRAAMASGCKVLDKYYAKTDESVLYRCAMLLHPRYKTAYFAKQNWPSEWVDTAIQILRAEWQKNYK